MDDFITIEAIKLADRHIQIENFVRESNAIEGIKNTTRAEIQEMHRFLALPEITIAELERFVSVYQPDAVLRDKKGLNVRVGRHVAPKGGPKIREYLQRLLHGIGREPFMPYHVHCRYEELHPFTDCNGRSGRALWAWIAQKRYGEQAFELGFLHRFYYQALEDFRI